MFYVVLCLKSILGFLLSERTSGVYPVSAVSAVGVTHLYQRVAR